MSGPPEEADLVAGLYLTISEHAALHKARVDRGSRDGDKENNVDENHILDNVNGLPDQANTSRNNKKEDRRSRKRRRPKQGSHRSVLMDMRSRMSTSQTLAENKDTSSRSNRKNDVEVYSEADDAGDLLEQMGKTTRDQEERQHSRKRRTYSPGLLRSILSSRDTSPVAEEVTIDVARATLTTAQQTWSDAPQAQDASEKARVLSTPQQVDFDKPRIVDTFTTAFTSSQQIEFDKPQAENTLDGVRATPTTAQEARFNKPQAENTFDEARATFTTAQVAKSNRAQWLDWTQLYVDNPYIAINAIAGRAPTVTTSRYLLPQQRSYAHVYFLFHDSKDRFTGTRRTFEQCKTLVELFKQAIATGIVSRRAPVTGESGRLIVSVMGSLANPLVLIRGGEEVWRFGLLMQRIDERVDEKDNTKGGCVVQVGSTG